MKWFIGALFVLLGAWVFNLGLLAYAMYVLLAMMLVSRLLTRWWAAGVSSEREHTALTANIGEVVTILVKITNSGKLPIPWLLLEDLLPPAALVHDPPNLKVMGNRIALMMMRPGARKSMLYRLQCNRRGYYQIGPLILETGDLFGLHRRYRVLTEPHFLLVYPDVVPLEGFEIASQRPIGEVRMTYRLYEDPTRIAGVRRYEAGDPMNRVHWRATARTGQLHSKVYEPSTVAGTTILLDFHTASHDRRTEPYRSELSITTAASIANAIYQMNQQVGLITNGRDAADRIRQEGWAGDARSRAEAQRSASMAEKSDRLEPLMVPTRRGPQQVIRILELLARLELTDGLTLAQLVAETHSRIPRDATVVAITPHVTSEMAIALGNLRRQGYAVSVLVSTYEEYDFAQASGPLAAEGVETRHLKEEASIATVCQNYVLR